MGPLTSTERGKLQEDTTGRETRAEERCWGAGEGEAPEQVGGAWAGGKRLDRWLQQQRAGQGLGELSVLAKTFCPASQHRESYQLPGAHLNGSLPGSRPRLRPSSLQLQLAVPVKPTFSCQRAPLFLCVMMVVYKNRALAGAVA